jgi:DNA-binding NarL/FixJ family response regulator
MSSSTSSGTTRVLVVGSDARVTRALTAAIGALPNTTALSAPDAFCDEHAPFDGLPPHVAVVDIAPASTAHDLQQIRRLARCTPVVAVSDTSRLAKRAVEAGAACMCDKDGDMAALVDAVKTLASSERAEPGGTARARRRSAGDPTSSAPTPESSR